MKTNQREIAHMVNKPGPWLLLALFLRHEGCGVDTCGWRRLSISRLTHSTSIEDLISLPCKQQPEGWIIDHSAQLRTIYHESSWKRKKRIHLVMKKKLRWNADAHVVAGGGDFFCLRWWLKKKDSLNGSRKQSVAWLFEFTLHWLVVCLACKLAEFVIVASSSISLARREFQKTLHMKHESDNYTTTSLNVCKFLRAFSEAFNQVSSPECWLRHQHLSNTNYERIRNGKEVKRWAVVGRRKRKTRLVNLINSSYCAWGR